jgi:4-nitrophenyl phosphatase
LYQQALSALGTRLEHTVAIGDRLNTDILGAVNAGIRSILVLTGISTQQELQDVDYQPTWVMQDIEEITRVLRHTFLNESVENENEKAD